MRAVVYTKYGPPEVAKLMEVPTPLPKDNELLIKVYASTVNRTDAGFRSAEYFISRFWTGILRPKHQILGCEFAGMIEDICKFNTFSRMAPSQQTQNFADLAIFAVIKSPTLSKLPVVTK